VGVKAFLGAKSVSTVSFVPLVPMKQLAVFSYQWAVSLQTEVVIKIVSE